MGPDDRSFLEEMVQTLDASMRALEDEEERLCAAIGKERVSELRSYLRRELEPVDIEEIRRTLDYEDRKLISTWIRLERNRARRVAAGRGAMLLNAGREDIDISTTTRPKKT